MEENKEIEKSPLNIVRGRVGFKLEAKDKEKVSDLDSMTVPNEAMSLREIIERFTKGAPVPSIAREGVFNQGDFDDQDLEKVPGLDLVEKSEFTAAVTEKRKQLEEEIKRDKAEKDKRAAELAKEDQELREELRKRKASKSKEEGKKDQGDGGPEGENP